MLLYEQDDASINRNLITLIIVSVLLFLNYLFSNDYLALICTIFVCIYLVICHMDQAILTMIFLTSFAYLFRFSGIETFGIVCIIFILKLMLHSRKNLINGGIGMILYILVHLISTNISELSFAVIVPFTSVWCLYFAVSSYKDDIRDSGLTYFVIAHLISSVMGIFKGSGRLAMILSNDYLSVASWQDTVRFSGLSYDANFYTLTAVLGLFVTIYVLKDRLKYWIWILTIGIILVFGAFTYSKSFYFCAGIIIIVSIFSSDRTLRGRILKSLPIVIITMVLASNQINTIILNFAGRFSDSNNLNILTTGRVVLWKEYVELIFQDAWGILFGHGIISNGLKAAHNTYLEILYKFGFLGGAVDILYIFSCGRKVTSENRDFSKSILIILFLLLLFNLSAYTFYGLWVSIFIIWLIPSKSEVLL